MEFKTNKFNYKSVGCILLLIISIIIFVLMYVNFKGEKNFSEDIPYFIPAFIILGYLIYSALSYSTGKFIITDEAYVYTNLFKKTNIQKKDVQKICIGIKGSCEKLTKSEYSKFTEYGINILSKQNIFIDEELFKKSYGQLANKLNISTVEKSKELEKKEKLLSPEKKKGH